MAAKKPKSPKIDPDKAVLSRCLQGDDEAFNELVLNYQRRVIQLCFNHLNQYEEACDLAQEVFVQVYHNLGSFRGQSSFSTWLYRVALNACYNRQKWMAAKGRNKVGSLEGLLEHEEMQADRASIFKAPGDDALGQMQHDEVTHAVRLGLSKLSPEFQKVIELVDLEGMSYEEASQVIEVPVNTVRSRLSRAREGLRQQMMHTEHKP